MGLDMTLKAEFYVNDADRVSTIAEAVGLASVDQLAGRHATVRLPVAYWRKANAIHGWFVRNLMNGNDDCQTVEVPHGYLAMLRELCQSALDTKDPAGHRELQPTEGFFFFGSTEIDDYYWFTLAETVRQIDRLALLPGDATFFYRASW